MNKRIQWMVCLMVAALLFATGCKEDNGTDDGDGVVPGQAIAGIWRVNELDDVSVPQGTEKTIEASDFESFQLTITATPAEVSYTTQGSGSPVVFPSQGTLEVEESDDFNAGAEVLRQPDLVPMTMTLLQDSTLQVAFSVGEEATNGRIAGISGQYTFVLHKQEQI